MAVALSLSVTSAANAEALLARHDGITRLQFGSEFCENLLPSPAQLRQMLKLAEAHGLAFSLVTPICSDRSIRRLRKLLALLPPRAEVVANDWGVLRLLHTDFPALAPVAGRLICKQVKDPRLPSAQWTQLYPHGIHAAPFIALLKRFGVGRVEMDVAPFAAAAELHSPQLAVSAHAPWGFAVKGRACRIGSLNLTDDKKFAIDGKCRRECLDYAATMTRDGSDGLPTVQRGNALFYRHDEAMTAALNDAVNAGYVDRLIVSGDWP
jgi:hypothetical protein